MDTLYKCLDCGAVFYQWDALHREETIPHTEINGPYYEHNTYDLCPKCGSDDLMAGEPCMLCEDDFSTHGLCDACRDELKDSLTITAKALHVSVGKLLDAMNCYGDYYHDGL